MTFAHVIMTFGAQLCAGKAKASHESQKRKNDMAHVYLMLFYILCVVAVGIYVSTLVSICRKLSQEKE